MVQPLSFILLFAIFAIVSFTPTPADEDLTIAARQFDPIKALHKRGF